MYITVLGTTTAVALLGLSALMAIRIERRAAGDTGDFAQARLYARAAIEMGLLRIDGDANWRTTYPNGTWETDRAIGDGSYTLEGVDPDDAILSDTDTDPVQLTGIGVQGDARCKVQVILTARVDPIDALTAAIHAGSLRVMGGKALTATGAPASTNGLLQLDGGATVTGDVEAASLNNGGTITGTTTVPAAAKDMPDPGVIDSYAALATPIAAPSGIDGQVLAAGYNPWGTPDAGGVYLIDAAGGTISITNTRLHGTLVIRNPTGTVVLDSAVFFQNYRADYPVLLVRGDLELLFPSDGNSLSETSASANFNPVGAPHLGVTDDLQDDTYPSEIQGLVHVTGTLRLKTTARVRGAVICEGAVTADDDNEIVHDADLRTTPPVGYTKPPVMIPLAGSWRRVVD